MIFNIVFFVVISSGSTIIESGDALLVLANKEDLSFLQQTLAHLKKERE